MAYKVKKKSAPPKGRREEEEDDLYDDDDTDDDYEEDDDRPRNKKVRSTRDDDDDDDDDDDEDALVGGWGAHHRNKAETSNYPNKLELHADPALVRFLDDEPLVSYKQHWIERKGKKSFYCIGKDCPLCNMGDKPRVKNIFNVVRLDEGSPVNLVLETGPRLTDILESKSRKTSLSRAYWGIAMHGKAGNTNFDVAMVKERDLEDDFDAQPLDPVIFKKLKTTKWKKEDVVQIHTRKELAEIAKEATGDYDDDDDDD